MTHRTTFALDQATAERLKRLALRWKVSQAEVVRRSVEQAERQPTGERRDPVAMLQHLRETGGGLDAAQAENWVTEIREDRKRWRAS